MSLHRDDMRAGFMALLVGMVALAAIVFGVVQLTNMKYADQAHGGAAKAPAATGTRH